jgi:3-deoxy-D-manno-octulosonic acid kinase
MAFERIAVPGGALLYDPRISGDDAAALFDRERWQRLGAIEQARGARGSISFIDSGEREYVLRRYLRGGLVAKLSRERYVWLGEERTRAFRELRLLGRLRDLGLPVPAPVAARYLRQGPTYSAELVTERLPGSRSLAEAWLQDPTIPPDWEAVGGALRLFHDRGVQHADLNANNIMLGEAGQVWLLDFDRGRIREPGAWYRKPLERLARSLAKVSRGTPQAAEASRCHARIVAAHDRGSAPQAR